MVSHKDVASYFSSQGVNYKFYLPESANSELILSKDKYLVEDSFWTNPEENESFYLNMFSTSDIILIDLVEDEYIKFRFLANYKYFICSLTLFKFKAENYFGDTSIHISLNETNESINRTRVFSGEQFIIIQDSILKTKQRQLTDSNMPTALVTMGGSDPLNILSKVLDSMDLISSISFKCIVIGGAANKQKDSIKKRVEEKENFFYYDSIQNIEKIYSETDLAIINGGNTRYELVYLGIPYCCISMHQVQYNISQQLIDKYGGINLGISEDLQVDYIADQIVKLLSDFELRKEMIQKMKTNSFEKGCHNIYSLISNRYYLYTNEKNN